MPVHVSLVVVSPDGQIAVPWCTAEDEPVPPGEEMPTPRLRLEVPDGADAFYRIAGERFRFVVTSQRHDLRNMQQPPVTRLDSSRGLRLHSVDEGVYSGTKTISRADWLTVTLEFRSLPGEDS
jgi:hypothetical protein